MSDAANILVEARRAGVRLWREGGRIAIAPAQRCPAALLGEIRAHKPQLLDLLSDAAPKLPTDQLPWLHVARQVLAGEFDGADRSTRESLCIGLRAVDHSLPLRALQKLAPRRADSTR